MEKPIDFFQEVRSLIELEKKQALDRFRRLDPDRLIPAESGAMEDGAVARIRRFRPAVAWSTVGMVVVAGMLLVLMLFTTSRMNPVKPPLPSFLARVSLFGRYKSFPLTMGPFPSRHSPLKPLLENMAIQAGQEAGKRIGRPETRGGENVSPVGVMSKIEKIIRERTLERLVTRFWHSSEEV